MLLKDAPWNHELERPRHRFSNFRIEPAGQRRMDLNPASCLPRQLHIVLKATRRSLRISDVGAEKRLAAIELEIKITLSRFGLGEKLNATVLPHFVLIILPHASHISILPSKNPVQTFFVIQQPGPGLRSMLAAFRPKKPYLQCFGI